MADSGEPIVIENAAAVAAPEDGRPRRRWLRPVLMLSVPLLIAAGAGYMWITGGRYVSTDNAYVQQDMVSVSPDVSGRIVEVLVRENQSVKAGDVLFRIDPEPYRIALQQAEAALATARVQVSTMSTDMGGAAADIASARADIQLAQASYDRQAALMQRGFTTRASFDAAQQQVAAAKAKLGTAQADAARARAQIGSGSALSGTPAGIQAALAQRAKAALDLDRTVVRAPADGIVSQTNRLQVGTISPSGVPALSLVISHQAWVEANYKETDLDHMAVGQPAEIELDAYPEVKIRGHVASIGAGTGSEFSVLPAQNANGNWVKVTQRVPVRIAIDGAPSRPMIAGLSADVAVDTRAGRD
ncbi:HlyD family secretion protein [Sphingomonas cavernae]|uniref:HlyD family secretion protein n=1 Tax=Sphingomonas cavernae TaxID=2320861 RepID=A0A418WM11_9SPHN|nr:HlyD family secretion protein [Sphingomonas cavernae]RJF91041.1 HlyD family secretion protein [Sphingomonas cavernae]